jgi:DNA-binding GntR family transcriptional regulator
MGLEKKPLSEEVFHIIRELIETGEMSSGSKISEPSLAKKLMVSRGPIRDAIAKLKTSGLVVRQLNIGARVLSLTNEQLIEIYHIREHLEGLAARFAAQNIDNESLEYLQLLLSNQEKQLNEKQEYYQKEGDLDFHYLIVKASYNKHLINLFNDSLYYLIRVYRFQYGMKGRRVNFAHKEHSAIVDAIANQDGEMAELLMRQHIRLSRMNVEKQINWKGGDESRKAI